MAFKLKERYLKWALILPTVILLLFLVIFPLMWSLGLSFYKYSVMGVYGSGGPQFVGLANYIELISDPTVWARFKVTAQYVAVAVPLQFFIGFTMASLMVEKFRGRRLVLTIFLMPMTIAPIAASLFFRFIMDGTFGILNYFTKLLFNTTILWITSYEWALISVIIVDTWMWSPFMMLIILAGLTAVPRHLYEAAAIDRASWWMKFRHITLPVIKPILAIALLFRTMDAFKLFDTIYILTGGGPGSVTETVALQIFREVFLYFHTGLGSALSYIFMAILIVLVNIYLRYLTRRPPEEEAALTRIEGGEEIPLSEAILGEGFGPTPPTSNPTSSMKKRETKTDAGVKRTGTISTFLKKRHVQKVLKYIAIVVLAAIFIFPVYWMWFTSFKTRVQAFAIPPVWVFQPTMSNYKSVFWTEVYGFTTFTRFTEYFLNTAIICGGSVIIAILLGIFAAYSFSRFEIKGKNTLMFFILSLRILPPVSTLIPIYFLYRFLQLKDTYPGIILIYTMFSMSFAVWMMKGFFDEIPKEFEEAAMVDGYSRMRAFIKATLPQAMTGVAATAVFCLMQVWNEFLFAYILDGFNTKTAAVAMAAVRGETGINWGWVAATQTLFTAPIMIFTYLIQPHLLRGVTFGTIKK